MDEWILHDLHREIPFIFLWGQGMQEGETRKKRTRHSTTARQKQRRVEPPTREDLPPAAESESFAHTCMVRLHII